MVTSARNLSNDGIICSHCQKLLSAYDSQSGAFSLPVEQLHSEGAVPIPNFGWFCSQSCALAYEDAHRVRFQRGASGLISYYDDTSN